MRVLVRDAILFLFVGYFYFGYKTGDIQLIRSYSPRQLPELVLVLVIGLIVFDIYRLIKSKNLK